MRPVIIIINTSEVVHRLLWLELARKVFMVSEDEAVSIFKWLGSLDSMASISCDGSIVDGAEQCSSHTIGVNSASRVSSKFGGGVLGVSAIVLVSGTTTGGCASSWVSVGDRVSQWERAAERPVAVVRLVRKAHNDSWINRFNCWLSSFWHVSNVSILPFLALISSIGTCSTRGRPFAARVTTDDRKWPAAVCWRSFSRLKPGGELQYDAGSSSANSKVVPAAGILSEMLCKFILLIANRKTVFTGLSERGNARWRQVTTEQ